MWIKLLGQGFYNSVKIKFQEYSWSFPGELLFFLPRVTFGTKLVYIGLQKCRETKILSSLIIATAHDWNTICYEMYRISTTQTNPNCISIQEIFLDLLFSRIDLNNANMKIWYTLWGINTCNMTENLASNKMENGDNTTMTIPGTSLTAISSNVVWQILNSRLSESL